MCINCGWSHRSYSKVSNDGSQGKVVPERCKKWLWDINMWWKSSTFKVHRIVISIVLLWNKFVLTPENINCKSFICSGNWGGRTGLEKVLLVIVGVLVVTAIVLSTSLYASGYIDGEGRGKLEYLLCFQTFYFCLILIKMSNRNLIIGTAQDVCTTKACAVAGKKLIWYEKLFRKILSLLCKHLSRIFANFPLNI